MDFHIVISTLQKILFDTRAQFCSNDVFSDLLRETNPLGQVSIENKYFLNGVRNSQQSRDILAPNRPHLMDGSGPSTVRVRA